MGAGPGRPHDRTAGVGGQGLTLAGVNGGPLGGTRSVTRLASGLQSYLFSKYMSLSVALTPSLHIPRQGYIPLVGDPHCLPCGTSPSPRGHWSGGHSAEAAGSSTPNIVRNKGMGLTGQTGVRGQSPMNGGETAGMPGW